MTSKQGVAEIRATLKDMRRHGLRGGLPQEHAFTLLDEIERLTHERNEYKVWWERDSGSLSKVLNDLSMERACKQDFRAARDRLRAALKRIDAHLEVRPDDPLENLQVVAGYGNSLGFWLALKAAREELSGEPPSAVETAAGLTDWEKACDVVAGVVRSLGGEARIGATIALDAIGDAMRGTPASPVETTREHVHDWIGQPAGMTSPSGSKFDLCRKCGATRSPAQLPPQQAECPGCGWTIGHALDCPHRWGSPEKASEGIANMWQCGSCRTFNPLLSLSCQSCKTPRDAQNGLGEQR